MLIASEQDRPDVAEKRAQGRASQSLSDPHKIVFLDETWAKTNMTRTYGRSQLGTRMAKKTSCGRWETTTFLGALRAQGYIAPLTVAGAINGALFRAWGEQHLAPELEDGDIVVMDNLLGLAPFGVGLFDQTAEVVVVVDEDRRSEGVFNNLIRRHLDSNGDGAPRLLWGSTVDQILTDENGSSDAYWTLTDHSKTVHDVVAYDGEPDTTTVVNHISDRHRLW